MKMVICLNIGTGFDIGFPRSLCLSGKTPIITYQRRKKRRVDQSTLPDNVQPDPTTSTTDNIQVLNETVGTTFKKNNEPQPILAGKSFNNGIGDPHLNFSTVQPVLAGKVPTATNYPAPTKEEAVRQEGHSETADSFLSNSAMGSSGGNGVPDKTGSGPAPA